MVMISSSLLQLNTFWSKNLSITYVRGGAKQCDAETISFTSRNMRFLGTIQRQLVDRKIWNLANLITSVRSTNMPKMVIISWLGAAPQISEIYVYVTFPYIRIPDLFLDWFYTDQTAPLILRTMIQTTRFSRRKGLFWGLVDSTS